MKAAKPLSPSRYAVRLNGLRDPPVLFRMAGRTKSKSRLGHAEA